MTERAAGVAAFTYRSSRSAAILGALALAVLVETVAVHLWLYPRIPWLAWTLLTLSVLSLVWLFVDYHARGTRAILVDERRIELRIGLQKPIVLERAQVARAFAPTWRDLPAADAPYLNLTAPAQPNVLLAMAAPTRVPIFAGIGRSVDHLGLRLDDPEGFLAALDDPLLSGLRDD